MHTIIEYFKTIFLPYFLPMSPIAFYFFGVENVIKYNSNISFLILNGCSLAMSYVFYAVFFLTPFYGGHFSLFAVSVALSLVYFLFKKSNLKKAIGYFKDAFYSLIPLGINIIVKQQSLGFAQGLLAIASFQLGYLLVGNFVISIKEKMVMTSDGVKFEEIHTIIFIIGITSLIFYGFRFS